jgi:hypothetical protein
MIPIFNSPMVDIHNYNYWNSSSANYISRSNIKLCEILLKPQTTKSN